jgi:hypothetical protein
MSRKLTSIVSAAVALALSACLPVTTKAPVGSTVGFKTDPQLMGVWQGAANDSGDSATIAFLSTEDGIVAVLIGIPAAKDGTDESGTYSSYAIKTAQLGRYRYMNTRALMEDGKPAAGREAQDTFPILYAINGDGMLTLTLADEDAAKDAVKSGKTAGIVEGGDYGDITLTGGPAALDAFFSSEAGRAIFKKPFVLLHRVK